MTQRIVQMAMRDLRALVEEVLMSLPRPYTEHVIHDVFLEIEQHRREEYNDLLALMPRRWVNPRIGKVVKETLGMSSKRSRVPATSKLIRTHTMLR